MDRLLRLTVADWESAAAERLSQMAYDYFRSGADEETSLRRNREAFSEFELHYRALVDVTQVDVSTHMLGTKVSSPIAVAPTAYQRLAHEEGEAATARGAAEVGAMFTLSTLSTVSLETVAHASDGPKWFQLYVMVDRELTRSLIKRAKEAGYGAIVLTVDAPVFGRRLRDEYNGFALPEGIELVNLGEYAKETTGRVHSGSALSAFAENRHDASLTWEDLEWIRSEAELPLIVKGLVRSDDAQFAVERGADGIVVSNHGGRQLDGSPPTISVLSEVVAAVDGRAEVYLDSGIRWGTDVLKALALGAQGVLIGRPVLWGLAVDGSDGVAAVLQMLIDDLRRAMALCGCPNISSVSGDLIRRV